MIVRAPRRLRAPVTWLFTGAVILLCSCSDDARESEIVAESEPPPCRIDIRTAGITLGPVEHDGMMLDVGEAVARDSEGRFYTSTMVGGYLVRWDESAQSHDVFGRPGPGPGEFSAGPMHVFVDRSDSVFIRDNSMALNVFDEDMEFVRRFRGPLVGLTGYTHFLDDGTILSTYPPRQAPPTDHFAIVDRAGNVTREFGPADRDASAPSDGYERLSTWGGGDSFWVAPIPGAGSGYELQEWTLTGDLRGTLVRDVDWFRQVASAPAPRIGLLHQDSAGYLTTVTSAPNSNWTPQKDREASLATLTDIYEIRMEVIDPASRTLLASEQVTDVQEVPRRFFPRSRTGWRMVQNDPGVPTIEIVRMHLVANDEAEGECRA